ncbi:MAG: hypothetical protein HXY22_04925 [Alphaproteobacteria bacterium]|nr:hypothetical protein [Alphaproteobacteria bacterium]
MCDKVRMKASTPEKQLVGFIDKFAPEMGALIRAARTKLRQRIPQALELVYDNYNFFVIGYGPNEKSRDAILSLAAQAKGLNLCFLQGAGLPDPKRLLKGSGNVSRYVRVETAEMLDSPDIDALISAALARAKTPLSSQGRHQLIIKSISAKQRPRRAEVSA